MSVDCTSCGHAIPLGQFRCGKCGAVQSRDSIDDMSDVGELAVDDPLPLPDKSKDISQPVAHDNGHEHAPRESIVPRGTFASDEPAPPDVPATPDALPAEADLRSADPAASTHAGDDEVALPPASLHGLVGAPVSQEVSVVRAAPRPPFLASEILHEDLMPTEPGRGALTRTLRVFGALGVIVAIRSFGSAPFALVSVGSLALLAASALRVSHITRATMVMSISFAGLSVACFWRMKSGGPLDDALLAGCTTLLASALLFRAWYRGSNAARGLVASGLLTSIGWAATSVDRRLLLLDWTWQSWLPALILCVFVILCVLSLLAFMDDETTGACDIWAGCLLCWYAVHALSREALLSEAQGDDSLSALGLTEPVFAAPLAVALAQLLARLLGQQHRGAHVLLRRNA